MRVVRTLCTLFGENLLLCTTKIQTMFNIFKSSSNKNVLLEHCKIAIKELNSFREPSDQGKFEALICSVLFVLKMRDTNDKDQQKLMRALVDERNQYGVLMRSGVCVNFINSRFGLYNEELLKLYNKNSYPSGVIYNAFYLNPLASNISHVNDLPNVVLSNVAVSRMLSYLRTR